MTTKKTIYIIISLFFLLALFLVLFFIYPLQRDIKQNAQELVSQRNNRLMLESQFDEAANFRQKYETYKENLDKIDSLFADSGNPVGFIEFLEQTASAFDIKLEISTPTTAKEESTTYQNFQLSSTGSFSDTLKFIKSVEAGPYLIRANSVSMSAEKPAQTSSKGKSTQSSQVKAEISIKVYSK